MKQFDEAVYRIKTAKHSAGILVLGHVHSAGFLAVRHHIATFSQPATFNVDHIPTGYCLAQFRTRKQAMRFVLDVAGMDWNFTDPNTNHGEFFVRRVEKAAFAQIGKVSA